MKTVIFEAKFCVCGYHEAEEAPKLEKMIRECQGVVSVEIIKNENKVTVKGDFDENKVIKRAWEKVGERLIRIKTITTKSEDDDEEARMSSSTSLYYDAEERKTEKASMSSSTSSTNHDEEERKTDSKQLEASTSSSNHDLEMLHKRLTIIQARLSDAENGLGKIKSQVMRVWLKNLMIAACKAENVLDEIAYESLRRKVEVRKRGRVTNFFSVSNPLLFRPKIAYKVKEVNTLLDRICKEATEIGLDPSNELINANVVVEPSDQLRLTAPYVDDSRVVGRDDDASRVREMLLGSAVEDDLPVVAIVGMGGLGKTTLAQLLYKDKELVNSFDEKMWVCVSDYFDIKRLLNEMIQALTGDKSETPNIKGIVSKLREKLNGKKYLLVLDDVWNKSFNIWECMRDNLREIGGRKGSKVLVTTRSMEVVSAMQTSPSLTHHLMELTFDDSWKMFRKRAFANGGPRENQTLESLGRRMVAQCKGIPLAINSLGGLLYSKKHEKEWQLIAETEMWKSLANEDGILPILRLSYDHLPSPSVKQCFAFCSFIPKDFVIPKDELILLWMSLGYLQSSSGCNLKMEDVGNEYFNILLHNSFIQEVALEKFEWYSDTGYKMHDLVHDLALDVSEGRCLNLRASELKEKYHSEVQHLVLYVEEGEGLEDLKEANQSRSLYIVGRIPEDLEKVKHIRALTLECCARALPSSMRKLKHLRYLNISRTPIRKLPNYITSFYHLQTFILSQYDESMFAEVPQEFSNLLGLRHLLLVPHDAEAMPWFRWEEMSHRLVVKEVIISE